MWAQGLNLSHPHQDSTDDGRSSISSFASLSDLCTSSPQKKSAQEPRSRLTSKLEEGQSKRERVTVGVRLHLTPASMSAISIKKDIEWLTAQFKEANRLFDQIGVCFEVAESAPQRSEDWHMKTRKQRTALGRRTGALKRGMIDLFIVGRLEDVDRPGSFIRGVHWRDPKARKKKRWIILSRIAKQLVFAHELGHYFSLPHSEFSSSIMNKTPRETPTMNARGFVKSEVIKMKRARHKMFETGHLLDLRERRAQPLSPKGR